MLDAGLNRVVGVRINKAHLREVETSRFHTKT